MEHFSTKFKFLFANSERQKKEHITFGSLYSVCLFCFVLFCLFILAFFFGGGRLPVFMLIGWRAANNYVHCSWAKYRLHGASGEERNVGFSCLTWLK